MNPIALSPLLGAADPATLERGLRASPGRSAEAKAAQQFEAILLRQILSEALKADTSLTGEESPGGNIYQYMVTDVVSQSVAQGGGLGLARMLEAQLGTRGPTGTEVKS